MEYLRGEKQDEAKGKKEKGTSAVEDQATETQEAWQVPQEERSNESYLPLLVTIGNFLLIVCLF